MLYVRTIVLRYSCCCVCGGGALGLVHSHTNTQTFAMLKNKIQQDEHEIFRSQSLHTLLLNYYRYFQFLFHNFHIFSFWLFNVGGGGGAATIFCSPHFSSLLCVAHKYFLRFYYFSIFNRSFWMLSSIKSNDMKDVIGRDVYFTCCHDTQFVFQLFHVRRIRLNRRRRCLANNKSRRQNQKVTRFNVEYKTVLLVNTCLVRHR